MRISRVEVWAAGSAPTFLLPGWFVVCALLKKKLRQGKGYSRSGIRLPVDQRCRRWRRLKSLWKKGWNFLTWLLDILEVFPLNWTILFQSFKKSTEFLIFSFPFFKSKNQEVICWALPHFYGSSMAALCFVSLTVSQDYARKIAFPSRAINHSYCSV